MSLKNESKRKVSIGKRKVATIRAMLPNPKNTSNSISSNLDIPLLVRYIPIDRVK